MPAKAEKRNSHAWTSNFNNADIYCQRDTVGSRPKLKVGECFSFPTTMAILST